MATLLNRLAAIEHQLTPTTRQTTFHISLKGECARPSEQKQIDDAEKRGDFVICRVIVAPKHRQIEKAW